MLPQGWAPAALIMQQDQKKIGVPATKYEVFGLGAGFQQPSAYEKGQEIPQCWGFPSAEAAVGRCLQSTFLRAWVMTS